MIYLLDTNIISGLMKRDPNVTAWMSNLKADDSLITCVVCKGEVLFGIAKLSDGRRKAILRQRAEEIFDELECTPVPISAGEYYSALKNAQRQRGQIIEDNDLWVAATASTMEATLVSRDSDFSMLQGLSVLFI